MRHWVHGPVRFDRDVEALVLDPCFRGTSVEALARRLPCRIEWHGGFRLGVEELRRHPGYRGPEYVALGVEIARDGQLDPGIIGDAVRGGRHDPRELKKVWHLLARFGPPAAAPAAPVVPAASVTPPAAPTGPAPGGRPAQPASNSRAFTPICHR
jgi:hypothetical protein